MNDSVHLISRRLNICVFVVSAFVSGLRGSNPGHPAGVGAGLQTGPSAADPLHTGGSHIFTSYTKSQRLQLHTVSYQYWSLWFQEQIYQVSFNILTELQPLSLQSVSVSYCLFLNSLTVILKFEQKKHDLNVVPSTSDHWWILSIIIFCVHLPWSRTRCENLESSVICCNSAVWPAGGDDNTWRWRQLVQKYSLRKRGVMFVFVQISRLCPEEAAAQEQTGQVEECLKVNLLKIKQEGCKKVN